MSSVINSIELSETLLTVETTSASSYKIVGEGDLKLIVAENSSIEVVDLSTSCSVEFVLERGAYVKVIALKYISGTSNYSAKIEGEGANIDIFAASIATNNDNIEFKTYMNHSSSHTQSGQRVKCIGSDNSSTLFEGTVYIKKGVADITAHQQNKNLLLSDSARIKSNPWLEIYADDVKCSHGSTTGMLNPEEIFYMRQRGISEKVAQKLQIESFAVEIVEKIDNNELREMAEKIIINQIDIL